MAFYCLKCPFPARAAVAPAPSLWPGQVSALQGMSAWQQGCDCEAHRHLLSSVSLAAAGQCGFQLPTMPLLYLLVSSSLPSSCMSQFLTEHLAGKQRDHPGEQIT